MAHLKTLAEAQDLLGQREPFTTGTLSAKYDTAGNYLVFSYEAMIAGISAKTDIMQFTDKKYSQTTSRHLNLVKRAWSVN